MKSILLILITIVFISVPQAMAQTNADVDILFEGPVGFVVTDSQGKMCGHNPVTKTYYNEIPYAGYGVEGEDTITTYEFTFNHILKDTSFATSYTVEVFGTELGLFNGYLGMKQTVSKSTNFSLQSVIDSDQTVTYLLNYSTDSSTTPTMMKVVTPRIIRQDFSDCFKLNLLGGKGFYEDLSHQLENFDKHLAHKDSMEARRELEKFGRRLTEAYSDTADTSGMQAGEHGKGMGLKKRHENFVTQEAYEIISEDVTLMLGQLPARHGRGDEDEGRK
ncbi:MAG: hypothetical protein M1469_09595 [Bacteroidetes bacterium]|nr:hypothetical protein [Bacteroidota bacterium]